MNMRNGFLALLFSSMASLFIPQAAMADALADATALREAIRKGRVATIKQLLDRGVDPDGTGSKRGRGGQGEISGSFEDIREFTDLGFIPSPLMYAVLHDRVAAARLLIQKGATVNMVTPDGDTGVDYAARCSTPEMLELLFRSGARVPRNTTALDQALERGSKALAIAKVLVAAGSPVNGTIVKAVGCRDVAVVKLLVEAGADVNTAAEDGTTALLASINTSDRKHLETAKFLLEKGARVNARNDFGTTPLHKIVRGRQPEILQALLDAGADVHAKDGNGQTPLHEAARGHNPEAARVLIEKGALVNAVDKTKQTPLHAAAQMKVRIGLMLNTRVFNRFVAVAEVLLANGANVNAEDERGRTPLDVAKQPKMEDCLLKHGGKKGTPREPPRRSTSGSRVGRSGRSASGGGTDWQGKKPKRPGEVTVILKRGAHFTGELIIESDDFIKIKCGPAEMQWTKSQVKQILRFGE